MVYIHTYLQARRKESSSTDGILEGITDTKQQNWDWVPGAMNREE